MSKPKRRGLTHDELNHKDEDEMKHKWKHEKYKLIDNKELQTDYTPTREKVSIKHHQSNPNSKALRTGSHAYLWERWDRVITLVAINPGWNLASQLTMQILGPLALTCGCRFIVQGQPLQVVPFGHFPHEVSLSFPYSTKHNLLFLVLPMIGSSST